MVSTSSNAMQCLGIKLRAPAVGAKIWCLYVFFVFFLFVTLRDRHAVRSRGHILNNYCVTVYGWILIIFHLFSEGISLSVVTRSPNFRRQVAPQIFAKLQSKIAKTPKNRRKKFVRTTSYIDSRKV